MFRRRLCPRPLNARLPLWLATLALGFILPLMAQPPPGERVLLLEVDAPIGPASSDFILRGLDRAAEEAAPLVVIRLDTPGGLDSSMRDIIRGMLASPTPVAVWVAPSGARAASAGLYILYASQIAAMSPGTTTGAATPVQMGAGSPFGAEEPESDPEAAEAEEVGAPATAMERKIVNDAIAYIRGLAELQGRNADWGERAVREGVSLEATQAVAEGVADFIAGDLEELLSLADGRTVQVAGEPVTLETGGLRLERIEPDLRSQILGVLANPNIAYIFMLIGIYGIIFELASPGTLFPGVIGAISLLIALFSLNLLPVNYAGLALLLLGLALMAGEAFAPSFGVLGIGGLAAFAIGSLLMFDSGIPGFALSLPVLLTMGVVSSALLVLTLAALLRSRRLRPATGEAVLVGAIAEVLDWSGDTGTVRVHGELWRARAQGPLAPGDQARVISRTDLTLTVEPAPTDHGETTRRPE